MKNIKELVKYDATEAALQSYRTEFLPLTIKGLDDREGYEEVKQALLMTRTENANLERTRVQLKADSLEYGRAVDAEAKRIAASLAEVIDHLAGEKKRIDDEVARIKFEKEQREKLPERITKLTEIGAAIDEKRLLALDDATFTELLNALNSERLEKQRLAQEAKEVTLRAEQDKIDAAKRAVEEAKLAAEREERHKAEVEQARKESAENAKLEAEIEAKRKEDARIEAEKQAKLEAERIESERPDKEKLKGFALSFKTVIFPEVSGVKAKAKLAKVKKLIAEIVAELQG